MHKSQYELGTNKPTTYHVIDLQNVLTTDKILVVKFRLRSHH